MPPRLDWTARVWLFVLVVAVLVVLQQGGA